MTRILIVRFSSIGDIVLTTPVVRALKKQLPGTEIHYLTKPQFRPALEENPYIDQLHTLEQPLLQTALDLKNYRFDHIVDLHHNLRTRILKAVLDVPSTSFGKLNMEKWILVNFKADLMPKVHIVDRYMDTVKHLGVINDGEGLDYFLPAGTAMKYEGTSPYIAFAIGAQHATKRLPNNKISEICHRAELPVVLLGGKEDRENGKLIAEQSGNKVTNLCGVLSLHESALVVKHASRVITHDTGLMHIAAAFKKEIISVWGNTVPEFGMTPYYGNTVIPNFVAEIKGLYCRPCTKIGFDKCPKGHFKCMMLQEIDPALQILR